MEIAPESFADDARFLAFLKEAGMGAGGQNLFSWDDFSLGSIGSGALTGAGIGTMVPIPGVGTLAGAGIGAGVGAATSILWNPVKRFFGWGEFNPEKMKLQTVERARQQARMKEQGQMNNVTFPNLHGVGWQRPEHTQYFENSPMPQYWQNFQQQYGPQVPDGQVNPYVKIGVLGGRLLEKEAMMRKESWQGLPASNGENFFQSGRRSVLGPQASPLVSPASGQAFPSMNQFPSIQTPARTVPQTPPASPQIQYPPISPSASLAGAQNGSYRPQGGATVSRLQRDKLQLLADRQRGRRPAQPPPPVTYNTVPHGNYWGVPDPQPSPTELPPGFPPMQKQVGPLGPKPDYPKTPWSLEEAERRKADSDRRFRAQNAEFQREDDDARSLMEQISRNQKAGALRTPFHKEAGIGALLGGLLRPAARYAGQSFRHAGVPVLRAGVGAALGGTAEKYLTDNQTSGWGGATLGGLAGLMPGRTGRLLWQGLKSGGNALRPVGRTLRKYAPAIGSKALSGGMGAMAGNMLEGQITGGETSGWGGTLAGGLAGMMPGGVGRGLLNAMWLGSGALEAREIAKNIGSATGHEGLGSAAGAGAVGLGALAALSPVSRRLLGGRGSRYLQLKHIGRNFNRYANQMGGVGKWTGVKAGTKLLGDAATFAARHPGATAAAFAVPTMGGSLFNLPGWKGWATGIPAYTALQKMVGEPAAEAKYKMDALKAQQQNFETFLNSPNGRYLTQTLGIEPGQDWMYDPDLTAAGLEYANQGIGTARNIGGLVGNQSLLFDPRTFDTLNSLFGSRQ
jgi:hypothetical protein